MRKGEGRSTVITDMAHAKEGYEGKTGNYHPLESV